MSKRRPPPVIGILTRRPQEWTLVDNPNYAGKTPTKLIAKCHDGTPFISIDCRCGGGMHLHESQLKDAPADAEIATTCKTCAAPLIFPPGYFAHAFQELRDRGWIE